MKRIILAGVMAAAALCGCKGMLGPEARPAPVLAMAQPPQLEEPERPGNRWLGTQFEDVPVPAELTLDYDASYVSTSAHGPRVADLRYSGNTALTDVLSYTQQSMTRLDWRLTSLAGVAIKRMRYVKGDEECQLLIREGDRGESVLVVRIYPR